MSRSRKFPVWKDNAGAGRKRSWKRLFNRRLRRTTLLDDAADGAAYKRLNDSWSICDFRVSPADEDDEARAGRK